jgi:hypothetical protein
VPPCLLTSWASRDLPACCRVELVQGRALSSDTACRLTPLTCLLLLLSALHAVPPGARARQHPQAAEGRRAQACGAAQGDAEQNTRRALFFLMSLPPQHAAARGLTTRHTQRQPWMLGSAWPCFSMLACCGGCCVVASCCGGPRECVQRACSVCARWGICVCRMSCGPKHAKTHVLVVRGQAVVLLRLPSFLMC